MQQTDNMETTPNSQKMQKFIDLGLSPTLINALEQKGFEEPTEIQEKTIPILLHEQIDVIAQAQTGTGKTAAFGLVFVQTLDSDHGHTQALVLTPTRELCVQVAEEINSLRGNKRLSVVPVYGGQSIVLQLRQLKRGADIVVGTPGRILDHLKRGTLKLDHLRYAVLDEADEMLNMGFIDDIDEILSNAPEKRQLLLFSATMPDRIKKLARRYMPDYTLIQAKKQQLTTKLVNQIYFEVNERAKFDALCRIIDIEPDFYGIVFCRTKVDVDTIAKKLLDRGYPADSLHGDIAQAQRERILGSFRKQHISILVATDVAARGIDVQNLTHVINYSLPQDPESYVHRIGRTGRAGKEGTAITFATPREYRQLSFIMRIAQTKIKREKLPEVKEIISFKRQKIEKDLQSILENPISDDWKKMAEQLVNQNNPMDVLAALLKTHYSEALDEERYAKIEQASAKRPSNEGQTRLFITIGKKDAISSRKLVQIIEKETGVSGRHIQKVEVFETFSFVTVPFLDAEIILKKLSRNHNGRRLTAQKARPSKKEKFSKNKTFEYHRRKKKK